MYQSLLEDASLSGLLIRIDKDLAAREQEGRCRWCGGALHRADYPRRPRGPFSVGTRHVRRISFCCAREGCRRRATPASVVFLGRKVYPGAMVVLLAALRSGPTPKRAAKIEEVWGVSVRTLSRWRKWWLESFVRSPFWRAVRARFSGRIREEELPFFLVEAFHVNDGVGRLVDLLHWLSPVSRREGLLGRVV